MSRLNHEQLNLIKEKFNVPNLWSFSKVGTYDQCSWAYFLRYVKKIRVKGDSCYTWWGTVSHDIIQGYYEGKYTYEDMSQLLEEKIVEYNLIDDKKLKFPNDGEFESYIENLRHYFKNVKRIPYNMLCEKPVLAVLEGNDRYVFNGYIDAEFIDDEGYFVIQDFKTSSLSGFSGEKLYEKSKQLMLYAFGISQNGRIVNGERKNFNIDRIKVRYDMMKYCIVSYKLKNGKVKETKAERRHWVTKIANPLRKDLEGVEKQIDELEKEIAKLVKKMNMKKTTPEEAEGYSVAIGEIENDISNLHSQLYNVIEINEMISKAIENNSLENMPQFIQDKYTVSDCYIDIELSEEIIDKFKHELIENLDEIVSKEKVEDKEESFWRRKIDNSDSYYCTHLCDLRDHCVFYKEYREHQSMFIQDNQPSDDDILKMLGL